MVAFILPANSASSGYDIDNSLRFNEGDSPTLNITFGSEGSKRTMTFSFWLKRSNFGDEVYSLYSAGADANNRDQIRFLDESLDIIFQRNDTTYYRLRTNRLFRDPSAWYHIVIGIDTTDGTSSNRIKLYVNGVQESSFATSDYPTQNLDLYFNDDIVQYIGRQFSSDANHYGGYIAEWHFIDGTQYASSNFGETNDNGVWIPKKFADSFGSNGFKLEFQQTGTSQNSSGIGADTSGNDNHFAVSNLAATDVTTDTPTNNFCTMSPIDTNGQASLSEGNTQLQRGSNYAGCNGTFGVANGKWYWEIKTPTPTASGENSSFGVTSIPHATIGNNYLATSGTTEWAIMIDNADSDILKIHNNSTTDYSVNASSNDIFQIALDMDNNKIYFGRNGTFFASGNPAGNSNEAYSSVSGNPFLFPAFSMNGDNTLQANFGNPPNSISSGNADANGYGNFEYAPPSGYYALCTKNLAEFG